MNTDDRISMFRSLVRDALHAGWAVERDDLTIRQREKVEHAVNRVHEANAALYDMADEGEGE